MAHADSDADALLGRRVRKLFTGAGWHGGEVKSVRIVLPEGGASAGHAAHAVRVWSVTYDDGDDEEYTYEKLVKLLLPLSASATAAGGAGAAVAVPPAAAPAAGKGACARARAVCVWACVCARVQAGQRATWRAPFCPLT
jgi:hypothetical protein